MPTQYTGGRWLRPSHRETEAVGEAGDVGRVQPPRPPGVDLIWPGGARCRPYSKGCGHVRKLLWRWRGGWAADMQEGAVNTIPAKREEGSPWSCRHENQGQVQGH